MYIHGKTYNIYITETQNVVNLVVRFALVQNYLVVRVARSQQYYLGFD